MELYIVTGASRGLGEAMAKQLLQKKHRVIAVSRSGHASLAQAAEKPAQFIDLQADLADTAKIPELMRSILQADHLQSVDKITLINNAGQLEPIGPIGTKDVATEQLALQMTVNLVAPMLLTNCFIQQLADFQGAKTILNISSGAGSKPYYGWGGYCASKAGLDMFTRNVGLEQASLENSVKILSVAPGVVDTDMQSQIRGTSEEKFRDVERFIRLKEDGHLYTAEEAARRVLAKLDAVIPQGAVLDVRDD